MNQYLAMDIETGGFGHDKALLSAYFLVLDDKFEPVEGLMLLLKPDDGIYHVTAEALSVNRIDLVQHDKAAIYLKDAGTVLYEFFQRMNPLGATKLIPIGHNVPFDIEFVKAKIMSAGTWSKFVSYRMLDTGVIGQALRATNLLPTSVSGSLGSLASHFDVPVKNAHTADGDVMMTVGVLKKMLELIKLGN